MKNQFFQFRGFYKDFPSVFEEYSFKSFILLFENIEQLQAFIEGYLSDRIFLCEFKRGDFWIHEGCMYSSDWVKTREGDILHVDDANYCEGYDEYTSDNLEICHVGRNQISACLDYIRANDFYEYDGEYYDDYAVSFHDLVFLYEGGITHIDNAYYWECDGEYHLDPEDDYRKYVRDYHDGRHQEKVIFTKKPRFFIGIEVEKEDVEIKESIEIEEFEESCIGYRKERDGSLDDESGFEMVTPPYELCPKKIIAKIKENEILVSHFNADTSKSCGGHVNLSEDGLTGEEFFNKIKGYTPLLNALYFKRLEGSYCKAKSNEDLIKDRVKYQSIRIHSNRVEFRLVSALKNIDQLEWRLRLFELIVKNPTGCPREAYYLINSKFKTHLKKVYPNYEEFDNRVIEMTKNYENIDLK